MKYLFFVFLIALTAIAVTAQVKPVTNADLDKYRLDRERAEREYRENYAKLGFPSPEELARRREKSNLESQEFARTLRAERLEMERLDAERQRASVYYRYVPVDTWQQDGYYPYFWSYGGRYHYPIRPVYSPPGYYAGGQFWPTPIRTPMPKPVWLPFPQNR
jgi:hypothetical protein